MRKWIGILVIAIVAISLPLTIAWRGAETKASSYAEDRAQIMDLRARYMFALDFFDLVPVTDFAALRPGYNGYV
jgi:hypothetical protein